MQVNSRYIYFYGVLIRLLLIVGAQSFMYLINNFYMHLQVPGFNKLTPISIYSDTGYRIYWLYDDLLMDILWDLE